jgi:xanthine dehydrogenase iron-sulfur cluster and FAD-binding subunit A
MQGWEKQGKPVETQDKDGRSRKGGEEAMRDVQQQVQQVQEHGTSCRSPGTVASLMSRRQRAKREPEQERNTACACNKLCRGLLSVSFRLAGSVEACM